jgi:hypothetical protein
MNLAPLGYLDAAGPRAQVIVPLTWFTLIISILVWLIVAIVLWAGTRRASSSGGAAQFDQPAWTMSTIIRLACAAMTPSCAQT